MTLVSPLSETPTLGTPCPEGRVKCEGENQGYEPSSEESVGEESNRDKRDTDESIEEEEKGVEDNIGNCVTVLKLSNGVMFRVPVEVQGMRLNPVTYPPLLGPHRFLL
jgi:hypothetical protein